MSGQSLPNNATALEFDIAGKQDLQNLPPSNVGVGGCDVSWQQLGPALSNIPGLGLVVPRFECLITLAATTAGCSINAWSAVWKNATNVASTIVRNSTGSFTITTPATVSSEWDSNIQPVPIYNNYSVNFTSAQASFNSDPGSLIMLIPTVSTNTITLLCRNSSGLVDPSGASVFISAFIIQ